MKALSNLHLFSQVEKEVSSPATHQLACHKQLEAEPMQVCMTSASLPKEIQMPDPPHDSFCLL